MHPNSDARNKEFALSRIRQLSSSGLPLEPFVHTSLQLIGDGLPSSPNRAIHVGSDRSDTYISATTDVDAIVPLHNHYFVEAGPPLSGAKFKIDLNTIKTLFPCKTIWEPHEVFHPNLLRTEAFNETYRPLGWHHCIGTIFHEDGIYAGHYGVWRSADQPPFSRADIEFLRAGAPHITHGLRVAQRQILQSEPDGFAPLPGWGTGVVVLDNSGKPIAMDSAATWIFQQVGVLDGVSANAFTTNKVIEALEYVARTLTTIFHAPDGKALIHPPVHRLYQHWSGITLSLRGSRMVAADGHEYISVMVERGETLATRRARLITRWRLSNREAELLALIGANKTGPEIAMILGIGHDTVRKHTSHILTKLGVETRLAAAEIARSFG